LSFLKKFYPFHREADTQDIYQLADRGIPIMAKLQESLNVSGEQLRKLIENGQIGEKEVQKVFETLTSEGGMFYKSMELQSKTLTGQISNIFDSFYGVNVKIGEALRPTFDKILDFARKLTDSFDTPLFNKVITSISKVIGLMTDYLLNLFETFSPVIEALGEIFYTTTEQAAAFYTEWNKTVAPIMKEMGSLFKELGIILKPILEIQLKGFIMILRVAFTLLEPIAAILEGVIKLTKTIFTEFINMLNRILEYLHQPTIGMAKEVMTTDLYRRGPDGKYYANIKNPGNKPNETILPKNKQPGDNKKIETFTSQSPKIVNVNILSGNNASLIQQLDVRNIIDKSGKLTDDFKKEIESYLLEMLLQGSTNLY
jgi:hypothetical protein